MSIARLKVLLAALGYTPGGGGGSGDITPTKVTVTPAVNSSALVVANQTHTASAPVAYFAQTWNNAGVTFTGWKLEVTSTASAAASMLMDLQVAGVSQFSVTKAGAIAASTASVGGNTLDSSGLGVLNSRNVNFTGTFAGLVKWSDVAFGRKQAKVVEVNIGTAGSYVGTALLLGPMTVAQLPVAAAGLAGARATVSDATAPTYMGALVGGGSVVCGVFCNGTAWLSA